MWSRLYLNLSLELKKKNFLDKLNLRGKDIFLFFWLIYAKSVQGRTILDLKK